MTHIAMLTQSENTRLYFADVRVRLRLLNVADSAVMLRVLAVTSLVAEPHDSYSHADSAWKYRTIFC